jgi:hypothetical protein
LEASFQLSRRSVRAVNENYSPASGRTQCPSRNMLKSKESFVILRSVVKHVGRAHSFRGGGGSNVGCASQEAEASRRRLIGL